MRRKILVAFLISLGLTTALWALEEQKRYSISDACTEYFCVTLERDGKKIDLYPATLLRLYGSVQLHKPELGVSITVANTSDVMGAICIAVRDAADHLVSVPNAFPVQESNSRDVFEIIQKITSDDWPQGACRQVNQREYISYDHFNGLGNSAKIDISGKKLDTGRPVLTVAFFSGGYFESSPNGNAEPGANSPGMKKSVKPWALMEVLMGEVNVPVLPARN